MNETPYQQAPILVYGTCKLTSSIVVCLLQAGHRVMLCSDEREAVEERMQTHLAALNSPSLPDLAYAHCETLLKLNKPQDFVLAIAVTPERETEKKALICQLESILPISTLIGINTESIPLHALQKEAVQPERVIGLNWVEPAHTTFFLEIITNDQTRAESVKAFCETARANWQKDPYILHNGGGIRTRMLCAMIREAFYLVENGYVSVESIDRCCRNDAGYYMPFAGNFRYMDLMGTYIYGLVMQDLNPELSKSKDIPSFFRKIIQAGGHGMATNKGFYQYQEGEAAEWDAVFQQFSYQISYLIHKYPFNYAENSQLTGQPSFVHE